MMKRSCFILSVFCLFGLLLLNTACGGGALSSTGTGGNGDGGGGAVSTPSVTTVSLPAGTVGAAYATTLQAKGGTAPYSWSVKSGALPLGLSLSATGAISGTPSAAGTIGALVFEVTDAKKNSADSADLSLKVNKEQPPVVTTAALPAGSVGSAYSADLHATGGKAPYIWTVKSGTLPAGLTLSSAGAISGKPNSSGTFGALVFEVTDAYKSVGASANLSLKVNPPLAPQVTTAALPAATVGTAYAFNLTATGGSGVYKNWSLKSGTMPAGLALNSTSGAISGTPTKPGMFNSLVFQVTDADTATADSGNLNVQVYGPKGCSAGSESNLGTAPYAFLVKGFDANGPVTIAGSFVPNGTGGITGGDEDINTTSSVQTGLTINAVGSSYTLGPDNNGCLVIVNSSGPNATTFRFSVGTPNGSGAFTKGHLIEFDDNNGTGRRGTGILRLQDSSAFSGLNGMYAFLFTGTDAAGGHFGLAGSVQAAGGNFSNLALDYDDSGALATNLTGLSGLFSSADANGRGTASFATTGYGQNWVYYIVSSTEALFASSDALTTSPIAGGEILSTVGPFSASNLANNYVAEGTGLTASGPKAAIATGTFDGVSQITGGTLIQDNAGTVVSSSVLGTYAVDATTGRVAMTGNFITPVGYLVTGYSGVSMVFTGTDVPATSGMLEPQTSTQPAAGSYSFGTEEDADYHTVNQVGVFNLNSSKFWGTENESNVGTPFLILDQSVPATGFSFPNAGLGSFGANTHAVTSGSAIYIIDESNGTTHPRITSVNQ